MRAFASSAGFLFSLSLVLLVGGNLFPADDQNREMLGTKIANFALPASSGQGFHLYDLKGKKVVVVVFLSFECPVSNSYTQALAEIARTYPERGVAFLGLRAEEHTVPARMQVND